MKETQLSCILYTVNTIDTTADTTGFFGTTDTHINMQKNNDRMETNNNRTAQTAHRLVY